MTSKAVRNTRKLERPRPLKIITETSTKSPISPTAEIQPRKIGNDDVIHDLEALHININSGNFDDLTLQSVVKICNQLKSKGQNLELNYKEQLDRYFVTLRNASRESRIDMKWRLRLLEIIELRAMGWKSNENISNYYAKKILELEVPEPVPSVSSSSSITSAGVPVTYISTQSHVSSSNISQPGVSFGPGEVLKSSGKFAKPTKMAGKNYFKDEIVIRNSDSGKVMGIKGRRVHMIEELSDTIISFQRVNPGARDRLVQITGPNEDSINRARGLISDTIRRNASPVREKSEPDLEDVLVGSSVTLSNSSLAEEVTSEMNLLSGGKKLSHSFSMSDASVGEYAYSVHVGRDIIKVSGTKVDLVRTAKLVLEEYFAGQAELLEKQNLQQVMDSHVSLHHTSSMYMSASYRQECGDWESGISPQSPQSYTEQPSKISYLCNGTNPYRETTPSSISSNEDTYKAEDDNSHTDDLISFKELSESSMDSPQSYSDSRFLTSGRVVSSLQLKLQTPSIPLVPSPAVSEGTANKFFQQPLLSCNSKDNFEDDEVFTHNLSDKAGHFRLSSSSDSHNESGQNNESFYSQIPVLSGGCRISYSRDFLLDCSHSPLSQNPPRDLLNIASDMPSILRETSINFNPDDYRVQFSSISRDYCVGNMHSSEGRGVQDI